MNNTASVETLRKCFEKPGMSPGTFLGLASPSAIEVAGLAGCEWVLLDLEHGGGTLEQVGPSVQAANAAGVGLVVRVQKPERSTIGWMLDQGVAGVMLPRIEFAEEAREYASYFDYPPTGQRGVASYTRSAGWGSHSVRSTARGLCIVQIETAGAMSELSDIAALQGIDSLFIGPLDLSFALGVPEDMDSPVFTEAFAEVVKHGHAHNLSVGSLISDPARIPFMQDQGIDYLSLGSDALALRRGLGAQVAALTAGD